MAALHDGAGRDREVLTAYLFGAPIPAGLFGLIGMAMDAAMRANWPIRPAGLFQPFPGGFRVRKWGAVIAVFMVVFPSQF